MVMGRTATLSPAHPADRGSSGSINQWGSSWRDGNETLRVVPDTQRRPRWPILAFIALVAVVASVLCYLFLAQDISKAGTVIAAVVGLFTLVGGPAGWLWRKRDLAERASPNLDHAADVLAVAVRTRWHGIAAERALLYPAPIPVRWRWSNRPVSGPRTEAVGAGRAAPRMPPLPGMSRTRPSEVVTGGLTDLLAIYGGLDSGRILLMGSAGAGKSSAAIMLLLDALAHRAGLTDPAQRSATPVPVLLTFYGWNPAERPLVTWVASRLASDYGSAGINTATAQALLAGGKVALLLDGLDDLPADLRPVALRALREQATGRLVLLTRTEELADAVTGGHLPGAAPLELQPVTGRPAADYLARCQIHPPPQPWCQLIDLLRADPQHPVTQALDAPLMLSLVRDTYPAGNQLEDLLAPGRYTTRAQVEDHLLDRILPAAYTPRPGQPDPGYTLDKAQDWLSYIAEQMTERHTRDLAWWQMPTWRSRAFRGIASVLLAGLAVGLVSWSTFELSGVSGYYPPLVVGFGVTLPITCGLVAVKAGRVREPKVWGRIRWAAFPAQAPIKRIVFGFVSCAVLGSYVGFIAWLTVGMAVGLAIGLASACVLCFMIILANVAVRTAGDPLDPVDPLTCWRQDQRVYLMFGAVVGFAVGLVFGVMLGLAVWRVAGMTAGVRSGLAAWLILGFMYWLVLSHRASTWAATLTFVQIYFAGHGPLRMMRFLEDAHARQVLRTAGPIYQFRHARLQDRLQGRSANA